MKKNVFLFLILTFCINYTNAQFGPKKIITDEAILVTDIYSVDIDGDGNLDVLSSGRLYTDAFNIAWYKNTDGLGSFSAPMVIDNNFEEAKSIYAKDLDNDGDMDVLATSSYLDMVVWYENLDGLGNFGPRQIINSNVDGAFNVVSADLDGDNYNDIIYASDNSGVGWHKNLNLDGSFSSSNTVFFGQSRSVKARDLDGDDDLDLIIASSGSNIVYWAENLDGLGTFSTPKIIAPVDPPSSTVDVFVIDLDNDGDNDVISVPAFPSRVVWYENLDGIGNFGVEQIIVTDIFSSFSVFASDLDNDGDNDVLYTSTSENNSEIGWVENLDNNGDFGPKQIIINSLPSATKVYSSDLDNDGDMDVLSVSSGANTIAWYENYTILDTKENSILKITLNPNPTKNIFTINNNSNIAIKTIKIYSTLGKLVLKEKYTNSSIDISHLPTGLYLVKIETDNSELVKKILKE